jgi:hydroxymethylbilane synthase
MGGLVRIGTRESTLAVIQAEMVANAIKQKNPETKTTIVTITTTGDTIIDKTIDTIGGKGVFVRELVLALGSGTVDICVHSYKDMPAEDDSDFPVVALSPREDPRDVLILPHTSTAVHPDPERPVGCSSKRRQCQFLQLYPHHTVAPIRGNVLTRLEKLDRGDFSALVLAAAGIKRLGLWERASRTFAINEMVPACCQGILAVQGRKGEDYSYLDGYNDSDSWDASTCERAFIQKLNLGCGAPAGIVAEITGDDTLFVRAMIADSNNAIYRSEITGNRRDAASLGIAVAEMLHEKMAQGNGA